MALIEAINYKLIRSARKTISLQITADLQVVLRCPRRFKKEQADRFVEQHREWIEKHFAQLEKRTLEQTAFTFASGQTIYFRGQAYILKTVDTRKTNLNGGSLLIPELIEERETSVMDFLRREAKERLPALTSLWAGRIGLDPPQVKITSAKTRWGSCSGNGTINYSLRMSCLPPALEEYVVVHELCHLLEHNHSPAFHALVERFLPDQKRLRKELREFQKNILF